MRTISSIFLFLISSLAFAEPQIEGTPSELSNYLSDLPKTVSLHVNVSEKVSSDKAMIRLLVSTESNKLSKALQLNSEIRSKLRKKLDKFDIPEKNINESKFSSTPEYGLWGDEPKSYKVDNILSILIDSEEKMINVASIADQDKNIRYLSSKAEVGDEEEIKELLRNKAFDELDQKKNLYEERLEIELTPISFNENPAIAVEVEQEFRGREKYSRDVSLSSVAPASPAKFGERKYTMSLSVQYRVE